MTRAVVVGSGPNGLAAAISLAQAEVEVQVREAHQQVGGGTRTAELTIPGVKHDLCSAVHPFAVASPFLRSLDLAQHGLRWATPEVAVAHPLDAGTGAALEGSAAATATSLSDPRWQSLFSPLETDFDKICASVLGPLMRAPQAPVAFARFGMRAGLPASVLTSVLRTDEAKALFAGNAAHLIRPLNRPLASSVGTMLVTAGHAAGWPVAVGGSHQITLAMASLLKDLGGEITTSDPVTSVDELDADIVMFDLAPAQLVELLGDRLPARASNAMKRWKHGPAAFKVDLAIEGHIPWAYEPARRAGTVHVGGSHGEVAATLQQVSAGTMPDKPFVLVGQQYLADPTRSHGDINPIWAYAHVPHGYTGDPTDPILDQIERFAPGLRAQIVATHTMSPAQFEDYNPNYVGGDILTGANTVKQLVWRPNPRLNPYSLGVPGWHICSAATPPGAGVHGMCGWHAAQAALKELRG